MKPAGMFAALFLLLLFGTAEAQTTTDSLRQSPRKNWNRVFLAPAVLGAAGLYSATHNEIFSKYEIEEEWDEADPHFRTHADDYLQYAPIAAVYALNAFGLKGEHDFANRTALLVKSELFMLAMVYPLKKLTAVPRPDTGAPTSFPSGHTAQAFAAATFLHKEFGKKNPLFSVLAYGTAAAVGTLRVMNGRHWASDVLVGAGIGILSTNLAYMTHQNQWGKKHKHLAGVTATPTYGQKSFGLYLSMPVR